MLRVPAPAPTPTPVIDINPPGGDDFKSWITENPAILKAVGTIAIIILILVAIQALLKNKVAFGLLCAVGGIIVGLAVFGGDSGA